MLPRIDKFHPITFHLVEHWRPYQCCAVTSKRALSTPTFERESSNCSGRLPSDARPR
jgi:hypothetical protein